MLTPITLFNEERQTGVTRPGVRSIRTELRTPIPGAQSRLEFSEIREFDQRGRTVSRLIYKADGTVRLRQEYSFESNEGLETVQTFDGSGTLTQTDVVRTIDPNTQEVITRYSSCLETDRQVIKQDDQGRIVECRLISSDDPAIARLQVAVTYHTEDPQSQAFVKFRRKDGSVVAAHTSLSSDEAGVEPTKLILGGDPETVAHVWPPVERIDAEDDRGSWTAKTVFQVNNGMVSDQPMREIFREISYY